MKEDTRQKIEISFDSEYPQEFVDWPNEKGHVALAFTIVHQQEGGD